LPAATVVHEALEILSLEARSEVEVAELKDPKANERPGEIRESEVALAEAHAERLIAGESKQPRAPAVADA
jgi:hypothetical protein